MNFFTDQLTKWEKSAFKKALIVICPLGGSLSREMKAYVDTWDSAAPLFLRCRDGPFKTRRMEWKEVASGEL